MDAADVTFGVEEEFLLVDPVSGAPVPKNCEVAQSACDAGIDLQLELTSCQVETSSSVHTRAADLLRELRQLRAAVVRAAADNTARLLATGVPPTVPDAYPVTDTPRYRRIEKHFGMLAHEQGLCGCHVHVSVDDPETAVQISNHLRPWLPVFLSLTANPRSTAAPTPDTRAGATCCGGAGPVPARHRIFNPAPTTTPRST